MSTTPASSARRARPRPAGRASFDEPGSPLIDVTFCVVDLETTGGSPTEDRICEIGAVKVRGGECIGTLHTLVDPGRDLPPAITVLTGLTSQMVRPAPTVESVLAGVVEFLGGAVFVGHNVRFDRSFLDAALVRTERNRLANAMVDTCALARRLVGDEVPDCKLSTLADRFGLDHRPNHRALDDALATVDLLHLLLERAAAFGVSTLEDLLELPTAVAHPQAAKLALTDRLPSAPGVYVFRDATGRALHVGKASDLRRRVRSYFSTDTRRRLGGLLRETSRIDHLEAASSLEAAIPEIRMILELAPRYNRQGTQWAKAAYVKLTDEPFPRLSVVRKRRDDAATYLGPLTSSRVAKQVVRAVEAALPVRRCTVDPARSPRSAPCAPAQLGVSVCPCAGAVDREDYDEIADTVRRALTDEPGLVLGPLHRRMAALASGDRDEDGADLRDRAAAFSDAHRRVRRLDLVHRAGRLVVGFGDRRAVFDRGRLVAVEPADTPSDTGTVRDPSAPETWVSPADTDELMIVSRWLTDNAGRLRLEHCDGPLSSPLPRLPEVPPR